MHFGVSIPASASSVDASRERYAERTRLMSESCLMYLGLSLVGSLQSLFGPGKRG